MSAPDNPDISLNGRIINVWWFYNKQTNAVCTNTIHTGALKLPNRSPNDEIRCINYHWIYHIEGLSFCARLEIYAKRNRKYFTICNFTIFPYAFCYEFVSILYIIIFQTLSSRFRFDKPRTAHGSREKGGGM